MGNNKKYSKFIAKRALSKIPYSEVENLCFLIRSGSTIVDISKKFNISYKYASTLFLKYSIQEKKYQKVIGSKTEPYYQREDDYQLPQYTAKSLKGVELRMYKRLEDGKDERTLYRDNGEE